jgi:penicillin-binding protein 1A
VARVIIRFARSAGIAALFILAAIAGTATGLLFAYADDLPQISALDDYAPSTITRVYASGGEVIGEFATQRRVVIPYEQIPVKLRQALIAAEDSSFDRHFGLSMPHIAMAATRDVLGAVRDLVTGHRSRPKGASTITQQLARSLFAEAVGFEVGDVSLERKIKEAIVALQIEKRYTKREIFALYANQMYLGEGAYGVEAASRAYFGKSAKDLSLDECAMIAGLFQTWRNAPSVNPDRAKRRRAYVLQRMAEEGYISQKEADEAKEKPFVLAERGQPANSIAPYFVEEIRKHVESRFGAKPLYENGLSIQTTLDVRMQEAANAALDAGLRRIDKRRGFRKPHRNVVDEGHDVATVKLPRWSKPIAVGDIVPAVVTALGAGKGSDAPSGAIRTRIGDYTVDIAKAGYAWTRKTAPGFVKVGDVVDVKIATLEAAGSTGTGTLDQTPVVEGAVLAIDNHTGQIRAMVGGYSFARSKFNRAVQAYRQLGSTFKPIVYTAAIDRGYTPTSMLVDEPVAFSAGPGQPLYSPQNYDHTFMGPMTLRYALEQSRNVPAVRLIEQIGPATAVQYAKRFGFTSDMQPYLSLALGSAEATLLQVTSAYSVFPNQGVRLEPYSVLKVSDRDGNLLEEQRPAPHDAIHADTAFVMTNLMRGVALRGTAAAASSLDWPVAGKTGTVDDYTDAWFVGFDPDITVGVWVGYDEKKPLGPGESGSQVALPIWMDFMKAYIAARGREHVPSFAPPGNIVFLAVDRSTGMPTTDVAHAINEAFIAGTQPDGAIAQPAVTATP